MTREYTATGDRNYAIRVCSDDEAEAWDEALRQEGVERERARILAAVEGLATFDDGTAVSLLRDIRLPFVDRAAVIAVIKGEE